MSTRLYVGNLGYSVSSSSLNQLFAQYGTVVSLQIIEDRDTGRSKGFGFVEMSSQKEAHAAVDKLNDQMHEGRPLTVNVAQPRAERSSFGGGRGRRY